MIIVKAGFWIRSSSDLSYKVTEVVSRTPTKEASANTFSSKQNQVWCVAAKF